MLPPGCSRLRSLSKIGDLRRFIQGEGRLFIPQDSGPMLVNIPLDNRSFLGRIVRERVAEQGAANAQKAQPALQSTQGIIAVIDCTSELQYFLMQRLHTNQV